MINDYNNFFYTNFGVLFWFVILQILRLKIKYQIELFRFFFLGLFAQTIEMSYQTIHLMELKSLL